MSESLDAWLPPCLTDDDICEVISVIDNRSYLVCENTDCLAQVDVTDVALPKRGQLEHAYKVATMLGRVCKLRPTEVSDSTTDI